MTVDLQGLRTGPEDRETEVATDDPLWEGSDIELAAPMSLDFRAELTASQNVWVRGSFAARIHSACRRCLSPMVIEVGDAFEMLFDADIGPADEDFTLYSLDPRAEALDLSQPIRERVVLKVPSFPVCREDCRGLCAHCGANRNDVDCGCRVVEQDPRWGPLLALRGGG